jgi:hypothetical protein
LQHRHESENYFQGNCHAAAGRKPDSFTAETA